MPTIWVVAFAAVLLEIVFAHLAKDRYSRFGVIVRRIRANSSGCTVLPSIGSPIKIKNGWGTFEVGATYKNRYYVFEGIFSGIIAYPHIFHAELLRNDEALILCARLNYSVLPILVALVLTDLGVMGFAIGCAVLAISVCFQHAAYVALLRTLCDVRFQEGTIDER